MPVVDICHDWEFLEDGETIKPISVGLKASTGDEYYAVFNEAIQLCEQKTWLMDNVAVHFRDRNREFLPYPKIAYDVLQFLKSFGEIQLWADCGAYDHVLMAQTIAGPMINLPKEIPYHTNDIQTLKRMAQPRMDKLGLIAPKQDALSKHHALYDARHDMVLLEFYAGVLEWEITRRF